VPDGGRLSFIFPRRSRSNDEVGLFVLYPGMESPGTFLLRLEKRGDSVPTPSPKEDFHTFFFFSPPMHIGPGPPGDVETVFPDTPGAEHHSPIPLSF